MANNEENKEDQSNSIKPQSNADMYDDFLNQKRASLFEAYYERQRAKQELKKKGVKSDAEAEKLLKDATRRRGISSLRPEKLKALASKAKVLRRTGTVLSVLASTFWIWGPMILCFALLGFGAAMISQPTRFVGLLGKDCVDAAGDDQVAAAKCLQDATEKNNFDSFSNQGYI